MKNNKGFTLVELLAVIIILSSISLVAVVSISKSLYDRDEKECNDQIELAKNAAKIYFSLNDGASSPVSVGTLIDGGYLSDKSKTTRLDRGSSVSNASSGYSFNGNCIDS